MRYLSKSIFIPHKTTRRAVVQGVTLDGFATHLGQNTRGTDPKGGQNGIDGASFIYFGTFRSDQYPEKAHLYHQQPPPPVNRPSSHMRMGWTTMCEGATAAAWPM